MNITGVVQRALPRNGVKSTGVGIADILHFTGQGRNRLPEFEADDPRQHVPRCTAGGAPFDLEGNYPVILHLDAVFRQTELAAVGACSLQASETASGKGRHGALMFFAGGNHRDIFFDAQPGKVG